MSKIRDALEDLASTYGISDRRFEQLNAAWAPELRGMDEHVLLRAINGWMREEDRFPTLKALIEKARAIAGPQQLPPGCEHCDWSGWRDLAWHRHTKTGIKVTTYVEACTCSRGRHMSGGNDRRSYVSLMARWRKDPRTIDVFVTSSAHPVLTLDERLGSELAGAHRDLRAGGVKPPRSVRALREALGTEPQT